jgi:hypothetical protein
MIEELVRAALSGDDDAFDALTVIAEVEPTRLAGHLGRLYDAGRVWPPTLYRGANDEEVGRIIDDVDAGRTPERLPFLLFMLAYASDPLAEHALRRWHGQPPAGADRLHAAPLAMGDNPLAYARNAGWTVAPDGSRRELCAPTAYRLIMDEVPPRAGGPACPWCTSPLWTIADLDTGIPEVAEALAHTGWNGRLRIDTCHRCACYTPLYCQVTPDGGAAWCAANGGTHHLSDIADREDPPAVLPAVGPRRESPFHAHPTNEGGSTLGGHPAWIREIVHVDCTACGLPMDYLGLVSSGDVNPGEGGYYLYLHTPCGLTAVYYT